MSIKLRVAVVFTLALAAAIALGSWIFLSQLRAQLLRTTDTSLRAQMAAATQYRELGSEEHQGNQRSGEIVVQVVNSSGTITHASPGAPSSPMLTPAELAAATKGSFQPLTVTINGKPFLIDAGPTPGETGSVSIARTSLEPDGETLRTATTALIAGGAVFVVLGGLGSYWLAAAALSPVERMRREVAALSERAARVEVRVPRTRDELARLAGTMNDLLARLHAALARQRGLVADASHELRTPLAVLGAELELAGRPGRSREELAEAVAGAQSEVARLTRITNDLLLLARSDEGRIVLRPANTDIAALLLHSAEAAGLRAQQAGVRCVADVPDGLTALVDADRIRQAVDNLVDNALRFAPAGSAVTVAAGPAGPDLVIEVSDTGPGFPADFLPHAFERFRRPDTGRARSRGGAGLGLAIVAAIAAAHGGTTSARNAPEGGAVVAIFLPDAVGAASEANT